MATPFYIIDSFTTEKFRGNPTAVCVVDEQLPSSTMHAVAKELNFPVTAFVKEPAVKGKFSIRYFTITGEIPACGHATLASARVLLQANDQLQFETIENIVIDVRSEKEIIYMTYPKYAIEPFGITNDLLESLGLKNYRSSGFCSSLETLFIEIDSPEILRTLKPDHKALMKSSDAIMEVVITSVADDKDHDFLLRSFCPWIGIDEDPVTGSVHSVLAHFWGERLGKNELRAYQASERGGEAYVRALENKVELGGAAVMISKGTLYT